MQKTNITNELYQYALDIGVREHPVLAKLRLATSALSYARMQIPQDQGQFMAQLARIMNAKRYLEIGVFTGYSSLVMQLAMGNDAVTFALDNSKEHIDIAQQFWQEAGVLSNIKVMLDSAMQSLERLVLDGLANTFDIAFIDANKIDYLGYYEYCYKLVRPHGIILIDNVFLGGKILPETVATDSSDSDTVRAGRAFNNFVFNDKRVEVSVLTIADGLTMVYKK